MSKKLVRLSLWGVLLTGTIGGFAYTQTKTQTKVSVNLKQKYTPLIMTTLHQLTTERLNSDSAYIQKIAEQAAKDLAKVGPRGGSVEVKIPPMELPSIDLLFGYMPLPDEGGPGVKGPPRAPRPGGAGPDPAEDSECSCTRSTSHVGSPPDRASEQRCQCSCQPSGCRSCGC